MIIFSFAGDIRDMMTCLRYHLKFIVAAGDAVSLITRLFIRI